MCDFVQNSIFKSKITKLIDEVDCIQKVDNFVVMRGRHSGNWHFSEDMIKIKKPKTELAIFKTINVSLETLLRNLDPIPKKYFYQYGLAVAIFKRYVDYFGYDEEKSQIIMTSFRVEYPWRSPNEEPFIYYYFRNPWQFCNRHTVIRRLTGRFNKSGVKKQFSTVVEDFCINYFGVL